MDQSSETQFEGADEHQPSVGGNEAATECDPCPYCGQCRAGTHDVHRIPCSQVVIMREENGQMEQYDFDPGASQSQCNTKAVQSNPTNAAYTQSNHEDFDQGCGYQNYQSWNQCCPPAPNCCQPPPKPPPRRVTKAPTPKPTEKFSERVFTPVPSARYEPPPPPPPPKPPCRDFGTTCHADVGVGGGACAGTQTFFGSGGPQAQPGRASGVPNVQYYDSYPSGGGAGRTSRAPTGDFYGGYTSAPPNGQYCGGCPSGGQMDGRTSGAGQYPSMTQGIPSNAPVRPYYSSNFSGPSAQTMPPSGATTENFFPPTPDPSGAAGLKSGIPTQQQFQRPSAGGGPTDGADGCGCCCYDTTFSTPCCNNHDCCENGCCWWYGLVHPWNNCCCCDCCGQAQGNSADAQI